jgi:hypothetical protein
MKSRGIPQVVCTSQVNVLTLKAHLLDLFMAEQQVSSEQLLAADIDALLGQKPLLFITPFSCTTSDTCIRRTNRTDAAAQAPAGPRISDVFIYACFWKFS